jgi:hypothetical protein
MPVFTYFLNCPERTVVIMGPLSNILQHETQLEIIITVINRKYVNRVARSV